MTSRDSRVEMSTISLQENVNNDWSVDQTNDPSIPNCYQRQWDAALKPSIAELCDRFIEEKILFGNWQDLKITDEELCWADISELKLIFPFSHRSAILQRIHEQLGHAEQLKTKATVRQ